MNNICLSIHQHPHSPLQEEEPPLEEGEERKPREPLYIPYGDAGPYCPVTLAKDRWLVPGKKDMQAQYRQRLCRFGSEALMKRFALNPSAYLPKGKDTKIPPPRYVG